MAHTHAHGRLCGRLKTEKMYGAADSMHLAETSTCWHRRIALRNTDNYAWFAYRLGRAVYRGDLARFPTSPPPSSGGGGGGGNECSEDHHPPPGDDYSDPLGCQKIGQEWVCPGGGGGGAVAPRQCLSAG